MGPMVWKVIGTGAAVLAANLSRNALEKGWYMAFGKTPPANPESPDTTWKEAVAWAVASGAIIGTARMLATRKAAQYYRKSAGHLPKGMETVQ